MESAKKKTAFAVLAALTFFLGLFCFFNRSSLEFPIKKSLELDSPYLIRDYGNLRYILDRQRTRIVVVDKGTDTVQCVLPKNNKNGECFEYADDFLVDENGWIYVKEGAWDGNRIAREAVLVYDRDGNYADTFLDRKYSAMVNKHQMGLLYAGGGKIEYSVKDKNFITVASLDTKSGKETKGQFFFEDAFDFAADMAEKSGGGVYLLDKAGRLFLLDGNYKSSNPPLWQAPQDAFPNWIEEKEPGKLLYSDLYSDSVMELDLQSGKSRPVLEKSGAVTVTPVSFYDLKNPKKNSLLLKKQAALFAVFIIFILSLAAVIIISVILFIKSNVSVIRRISVFIVAAVLLVAGTITFKLSSEFSKELKAQILAQMENMAYSVANTIDSKTLESIDRASDFISPAYRKMIHDMETVIDPNLDINRNIYCDIFKLDLRHGAYACAYLDQAIGCFFPLTPGEEEEIKSIYRTARPVSSSKDDTSASYTYVSVPVLNEGGRVCGVVSVMTENFMLDDKISSMRRNVLFGIVVTMILIWLLMGESISYILSKAEAQMDEAAKKAEGVPVKKAFPHYYIRIMVFALFTAYNMSTTFLPMVIARGAAESLGQKAAGLWAALPISVNLFIIGFMAMFCDGLIRKAGCKKLIAIGASVSALSNVIVFAFQNEYALLFAALVIDGIGVGLTTNAMYLLISKIPDSENRISGYAAYNGAQISGINFGMLFGAALVPSIGRRAVFVVVAVMWILSAALFAALWNAIRHSVNEDGENPGRNKSALSILGFLKARRIWSFIVLVQIPFALMGGFIYYYLPLYSDANGLSEVVVAVLMMLYSVFAIYFGNSLTKFVISRTGFLSPYVSTLLSAAAVLLYAAGGTLWALIAAIFILGLANGFGRSALQSRFSIFDECEKFGISDAMGIFNFTDFIGQSFGPAVMGLVFLSKNIFGSALVFVAALVFVSIVHILLNISGNKALEKKYGKDKEEA